MLTRKYRKCQDKSVCLGMIGGEEDSAARAEARGAGRRCFMALRKEVSRTTPPLLSTLTEGTPILPSPRVGAMRPPKRPACKGGTWGTPRSAISLFFCSTLVSGQEAQGRKRK